MEFIEQVDILPRRFSPKKYRYEYEAILREFLDSKLKFAKVKPDIIKYNPSKDDPQHLLAQGLRRTVNRLKLPVKVVGRKLGVYLVRMY